MGATASKTKVRNDEQQRDTTTVRAVLYVRISDDPEGTEKGVDRQETDCRAYAQAHGMSVADVFRENDTSAFKQRTLTLPSGQRVRRVIRPRFRAMLQLLARHGADAGESLYAVSRVFNERGELTGNGKLWSDTALRQILRNPALKGVRIYRPVFPPRSRRSIVDMRSAVVHRVNRGGHG